MNIWKLYNRSYEDNEKQLPAYVTEAIDFLAHMSSTFYGNCYV